MVKAVQASLYFYILFIFNNNIHSTDGIRENVEVIMWDSVRFALLQNDQRQLASMFSTLDGPSLAAI